MQLYAALFCNYFLQLPLSHKSRFVFSPALQSSATELLSVLIILYIHFRI